MARDHPIQLTREQIYEMVWSEPVSRIAPRLGLSDVGLAKICDRLKVPRPGVGYWTKKAHGKAKPVPALPPADASVETTVSISPRERVPTRAGVEPAPAIEVPCRLRDPHPLVREAASSLTARYVDRYGLLDTKRAGTLAVRVSVASLKRSLRIMDTVIKALDKRGWTVKLRDTRPYGLGTVAVIEGQNIEFCLREATRRKPHELTPKEKADQAR